MTTKSKADRMYLGKIMVEFREIKVTSASKDTYWYAKFIGEVFTCIQDISGDYVVMFGDYSPSNYGVSTIEQGDGREVVQGV